MCIRDSIVTTGRTYALPNMVADGMLLPLNDLLDEHGKELKEKDGDYLKANQFGDNIYAVPGVQYSFQSSGIMYNKDIADAAGIEVPEHITMADLEDIAAKLKEYDPNLTLLSKGTGSTTSDMYFTMHYPQYKTCLLYTSTIRWHCKIRCPCRLSNAKRPRKESYQSVKSLLGWQKN